MTHDDETIERVARAICEIDSDETYEDEIDSSRAHYRRLARAALSALPERAFIVTPGGIGEPSTIQPADNRELLREALEALTFVVETRDCNHLTASDTFRDYYAQSCPICRARAAADKIRAALTQEQQT